MKAWVMFMKRVAGYVCCFTTRVSAQKSTEEKKKSGGTAERWKVLCGYPDESSGSDNWEGLLDPLDSDLRRYLIHYATMIEPAIEAFVNEPASKHVGLSRYARRNLLAKSGVEKGNPFKYEVTKYFYSPSTIPVPDRTGYTVRAARSGTLLKESNWIGYVAVATDEGKVALGRREILVVWRGAQRLSEGIENWTFYFVNAPLIFGQDSDPLVHKGWYDMYTTINQDSQLNNQSARDQIREEVARLVELYKDEEVSITVAGHSMGSSMATLNAIDLAVNPINNNKDIPITSFVLGSPKVGDENFKKAFSNQQNLRGLRVTDVNDAIPTTPDPSPKDGTQQPLIPYVEVGVGFVIEVAKSGYIRPEFPKGNCHDLMLYMHGIDGFQGSQGGFEAQGIFDIAKINKFQKVLKDEYHIPASWLKVKDKGMVQQDDGTYILDDHQPDEF